MAVLAFIAFFVLLAVLMIAFQKLLDDELTAALAAIGVLFGPLIVFGFVEWWRGKIDLWGNPVGKRCPPPPVLPSLPPTDRQLAFIEDLIEEREVPADDWALEYDPESIEEASATISYLRSLPYRSDREDS